MATQDNLSRALEAYKDVATEDFINGLIATATTTERRSGIFSAAVCVWLMIFQRLSPDHSLSAAIAELKHGSAHELLERNTGSIKVRAKRVSDATGGYCQGRTRVPLSVVEGVTDKLNEAISPKEGSRIYAVDGTTVLMSCSDENVKEFSQHNTRQGTSHYPLARLVIATEVTTGIAKRPVIGAHNGSKATSEISLVHELLVALESGSVVVADRLYGVFQVVSKTQELGLPIIVRLRDTIANKLVKARKGESGEQQVVWKASAYESKRYPHLADVEVVGRCIWKTIRRKGYRPFQIVLFSTYEKPLDDVVDTYRLRWNVEQDLRDLKNTLELNYIDAKSPDMVKKEIVTGVTAYNLIRRFMATVARRLKEPVRTISFKATLRRIRALGGAILSGALSEEQISSVLADVITEVTGLRLAKRKTERESQPRKKWRKGVQRFRAATPHSTKA